MNKDEKLGWIAELLEQRISQREICKTVGCSDWLIQQAIQKYDPPRRLPKGGRKPGEIPMHRLVFEDWEIGPFWNHGLSAEWLRRPIRRVHG